MKKVGILMGSDSDLPIIEKSIQTLKDFDVPYEVHVYSAHRTPEKALEFSSNARNNNFGVIICAAGMAAHLAGAIAANTVLPVIGIPCKSTNLDGMDALLSTVQMPPGIPVATVAINGGVNAALLAIQILSIEDEALYDKLLKRRLSDKEKVLDNISFKVNKGETVALVGSSGGGKTTIARLAARFYDADEGEILVGGINIRDYDKKSLMKKIAFVFQSSKLFKMSLRENLLLGNKNATEEEIEAALINSGSKEIVDNLDKGLDTVYGTKGTYFSGGESQRFAIARAFLKDAKLIILDEATAFADPENEHIIQESFKKLSKDKTTLMIAHRLSTVVDADKILVVDGGKIVESGKHTELLAKNGVYKKLWEEYQRSVNWKLGGKNE